MACMGQKRNVCKVVISNPEGHCLGKLGVDEMILKCACSVQSVHLYDSRAFGKPMVQRVLIIWLLAVLQ